MSRPLAVGVDVGGTHAKLALVATDGTVLGESRIDSGAQATSATLAPAIVAAIDATLERASASRDQVTALGLVVPGFVDVERRQSLFSPNTPGLLGDELPTRLSREMDMPVTFDSDVNGAAFGEAFWGVGRGVSRFLAITLGTGVGGGFVVDGALVRIAGGAIGDLGHVILEPGGRRCSAGCAGCAEALVGTDGLVDIAHRAGAPAAVDRPAMVIEAARSGVAWALHAAAEVGRLVGVLLASLMPILLPDRRRDRGWHDDAGGSILRRGPGHGRPDRRRPIRAWSSHRRGELRHDGRGGRSGGARMRGGEAGHEAITRTRCARHRPRVAAGAGIHDPRYTGQEEIPCDEHWSGSVASQRLPRSSSAPWAAR